MIEISIGGQQNYVPVGVVNQLRFLFGQVGERRVVCWPVRRVSPVVEWINPFTRVPAVLSEPADRTSSLPHLEIQIDTSY